MGPAAAAAITAGANFVGGLFSQSSARSAYQHRYQDTVKDMKKAGLNPALAYGQNPGGGAQTHDFGDVGSQAASASQAAAQARKTKAEANLLEAQTLDLREQVRLRNDLLRRQTEAAHSTVDVNTARAALLQIAGVRDKATMDSDIAAILAANEQQRLQTPEARARAKYYTQLGPGAFYLNNALDAAKAYAQVRGAHGLSKQPVRNIYLRTNR